MATSAWATPYRPQNPAVVGLRRLGSFIARVAKLCLTLLVSGTLLGGGVLVLVMRTLVRAAFASIFVWLGWNHGIIAVSNGAIGPMAWPTAFWCAVGVAGVALPFAASSSSKKSEATE